MGQAIIDNVIIILLMQHFRLIKLNCIRVKQTYRGYTQIKFNLRRNVLGFKKSTLILRTLSTVMSKQNLNKSHIYYTKKLPCSFKKALSLIYQTC